LRKSADFHYFAPLQQLVKKTTRPSFKKGAGFVEEVNMKRNSIVALLLRKVNGYGSFV